VSARDDRTMAEATLRAWAYEHAYDIAHSDGIFPWPDHIEAAYKALGDDRDMIWASILAKAIS